jgi:hypothetical protein
MGIIGDGLFFLVRFSENAPKSGGFHRGGREDAEAQNDKTKKMHRFFAVKNQRLRSE